MFTFARIPRYIFFHKVSENTRDERDKPPLVVSVLRSQIEAECIEPYER